MTVGPRVPVLTGGYLGILDPVYLFGIMCTLTEDALHLHMRCFAKLYVQHQTTTTDRGFTNGAPKFHILYTKNELSAFQRMYYAMSGFCILSEGDKAAARSVV